MTIDREGTTLLTYFAIDRAGNAETPHTLTIKLDLTDAILQPSAALPSPSAWLRARLYAGFMCSDALSGIASCTDTVTLGRTGPGQLALARAVDRAGNVATTLVGAQDLTPPKTAVTATPAANRHGWNRADVALRITATDDPGGSGVSATHYLLQGAQAGSGLVAGAAPVTVRADGVTTVTYWSEDVAGSVEPAQTMTVRVDKTPPVTVAAVSSAPNTHGINGSSAVVLLTASDPGTSGVESIHWRVSGMENGSGFTAGSRTALALVAVGRTTVESCAQDMAGNAERAQTITIDIEVPGKPAGAILPPPVAPPGSPPIVTQAVVATPGNPKLGAAEPGGVSGITVVGAPSSVDASSGQTPARLLIPSLGVAATVEAVGLDREGDVATPSRPADAAWFAGSVVPGQPGNAFIDGHLDWWTTGPAVFWNLKRLHVGDRILVVRRDGTTLEFRVTGTARIAADASRPELFATAGPATLSLVTCAGRWDAARHAYLERLVVTAVLSGT